ncbi:MAG TPA: DUF1932 domain-containing protein [Sphingobium sp.]|nr:DUF1932 domain-containing protein [Sphingobium sp.]
MADRSTPLRIALISPGAMGSALGAALSGAGHRLLTSLTGRSAASRARAEAAGMRHAEDADLAACDIILSVLPPGEASALVERLLPHIAAQANKPLFVDANALSPATKTALAARLATADCTLVDGAILGPPPGSSPRGAVLLLSGSAAHEASRLATAACPTKVVGDAVGGASALKMCFGGINKGVVGLAAALLLAAERHGVADALKAEMAEHMPDLFKRYQRQIPDMMPKAYRWVAEMREISAFLAPDDAAGAEIYQGLAGLFAAIADDVAGDGSDCATLHRAVTAP